MNLCKQTFFFVITLLLMSSPVFAGGAYLTELGSPQSVGTAGVANVTNNSGADAAFTNPAGMTGLSEPSLVLGSQLVIPTIRFDSDVATAGGSDGGNSGSVAAIPSLFAVAPLNENWRLGFGLSVPTGGGVDYGRDFVGRYQAYKSELAVMSISPSVAYRVNERLSLGAGVSFLYSDMDLRIAVKQPGPFSSDGQAEMSELDDWGYQGFVGVTYKASEQLFLGAVYRSEADVELEGDIKFKNITTPPLNLLTSQFNKAQVDFTYPQMLRIGLRYKLSDETMLLADVDWEDWSAFGDTRIGFNGAGTAIQSFDRDWDDTWHIGFAAAHRLAEGHTITGGISYDSSPVSDSKRTADLPADEQLRFSAAYAREFSDTFGIALGGTFLWLGEGKMDQVAQGERFKGEFSTNHIIFLSASLKYVF